jgi:hypothetical protein
LLVQESNVLSCLQSKQSGSGWEPALCCLTLRTSRRACSARKVCAVEEFHQCLLLAIEWRSIWLARIIYIYIYIYTVYIRYFWLGNHQIYGVFIRIYTVLANPKKTTCCHGCRANTYSWPEPYICTVYDRIFDRIPAKNTVYTPYTYGSVQPYN